MRFDYHDMVSSGSFQQSRDEFSCYGNPFVTVFLVSFAVEKVGNNHIYGRGRWEPVMKTKLLILKDTKLDMAFLDKNSFHRP